MNSYPHVPSPSAVPILWSVCYKFKKDNWCGVFRGRTPWQVYQKSLKTLGHFSEFVFVVVKIKREKQKGMV